MTRTWRALAVLAGFVVGCGAPSSTQVPAPTQVADGIVEPSLSNTRELLRLMKEAVPSDVKKPWSEAKAVVRVDVDETGAVTGAEVETSSGNRDFDEMALSLTQHMRFTPATRNGQPVSASLTLPLSFSNVPLPTELSNRR